MKKLASLLMLGLASLGATAQIDSIPERAVVLSGNPSHPDHLSNVAEMYSRLNLAFADPAAPRFLFLDKKGTVALGIGGYLKAVGMYDMKGAVDNNGFYTNMIPTPFDPAQRQRLGGTAAHSTLFLKMVTRPTRLGRVIVYFQTNFTGDNGGYGLKLDQAYVTVGHVTVGKARSTFADAPAMAPTIDDEGPSGQVTSKNILVQYITSSCSGFSAAASVELPTYTYTTGTSTSKISPRCPDIPVYAQYAWDKGQGQSHIRLSGIYRSLGYRDLITSRNRHESGWGVQASCAANIVGGLKFFGHYTYGRGIASYINDLSGEGLDLVPSAKHEGKLKAPAAAGWTAGLQYTFNSKFMMTASYSRAQLYEGATATADTYRYAQYIAANAFYEVWGDLRLGLEYLHGTRKNYDGQSGHANRIEAMLQFSF